MKKKVLIYKILNRKMEVIAMGRKFYRTRWGERKCFEQARQTFEDMNGFILDTANYLN